MTEKMGEPFLSPEIAKLSEKLQKDPASKLFFPLAEEYVKCSMIEEAIMVLTDGLKNHPGFSAARVTLGKVYLQKGQVAEAKAEFERVIGQNPDNLMAQKKLALIYHQEGKFDEAARFCDAILMGNPKDEEMKKLKEEIARASAAAASRGPAPDQGGSVIEGNQVEPGAEAQSLDMEEPVPEGMPLDQDFPSPFQETDAQGGVDLQDNQQESLPTEPPGFEFPIKGGPQIPEDLGGIPDQPPGSEPLAGSPGDPSEGIDDDPDRPRGPVIDLDLDEGAAASEQDVFSQLLGETGEQTPQTEEEPAPGGRGPEGEMMSEGALATANLAELYIRQGHYEQGIEIYRKILDQDPDNAEIRQRLEDAMGMANLLAKRSTEGRPGAHPGHRETPAAGPQGSSRPEPPVEPSSEQLRQAKIRRLQAWLEQLRRNHPQ